jgi:hypothetical protein
MVTASQSAAGDFAILSQKVEDVRSFANQTATFSFWAKAASGTPKITIEADQNFGSGGSASVQTTFGTVTISTSWTRYTVTATIPSVSGKTIGASSALSIYVWVSAGTTYGARTNSMGTQNGTFDLWGFQLEAGSTATAFQTATGTIQGELAACQRYYTRFATPSGSSGVPIVGSGIAASTTSARISFQLPVKMRLAAPSVLDYATARLVDTVNAGGQDITALSIYDSTDLVIVLTATVASGLTQYRGFFLYSQSGAAGYVGISAEL